MEFGSKSAHSPYILSVTSGKGGVGKTLTTVNMAISACMMGKKVLIFDGDLGLANVDVVLGLQPKHTIRNVLDGHAQLKDIIVEGPMGMHLVPSGSGVFKLTQLSQIQRLALSEQIERLKADYDLVIIDTGAGIAENVLFLNLTADQILVVTTPEPHAMTDAYAVIKVFVEEYGINRFSLLVNQARSDDEGLKVGARITDVARKFLKATVDYVGFVPFDPQVQKWVMQRRAASDQSSLSIAGQAWNQIARTVFNNTRKMRSGDPKKLWKALLLQQGSKELGIVSRA